MKHAYSIVAGLMLTAGAMAQSKHPSGQNADLLSLKARDGSPAWLSGLRGGGPANDECDGAIVVPVGSTCEPINGSLDGATESMAAAACSGFTASVANDVWFSFVATAASTTIEVQGASTGTTPDTLGVDPVVEVFGGSCTDLGSIACIDANLPAGTGEILTVATTPGATYYYRVYYWPYGGPPTDFSFTHCVYALAAPSNDDCAGATMLTAGSFCNNVPFSAVGATQSLAAIACNGFTGNANDDVWFSFVATAADMAVGATGADDGDANPNTGYDAVIEVFDACGGTSLGCADATLGNEPEQVDLTGLSIGNTYYFRVYNYYTAQATPNGGTACVVEGAGVNIGIAENERAADWSIFPNPTDGGFSIRYEGADAVVDIEVLDMTGRLVHAEHHQLLRGSVRDMELQQLGAGNYVVRLTSGGVRSTQRLVVR